MKRANESRLFVAPAISALCLLFAGSAWAQTDEQTWQEGSEPAPAAEPKAPAEAPAEPAPAAKSEAPPAINVATPEPEKPEERSFHVHNGFYLRLNIGYGAYGVHYKDDVTTSGGSLAFDLMVGGSPSRGVAIGGMLLSDFAPNIGLSQNGRDLGSVSVETGLIGPFIDGFPDPKGGFHLGGMVGVGAIRTSFKDVNAPNENDAGGGGAAWAGYDAWVGDEWSVGGLLRFSAAYGRSTEAGQTLDSRSIALTLMFTALYN